MEPSAPYMPAPSSSSSFLTRFENHLDKFLPTDGRKCELFKCVPGWIWLVGAGLSIFASVNKGWSAVLKTVLWEALVGWGVAWLCRGCHTKILWFLIIVGVFLPLVVFVGGAVFIGKEVVASNNGGCTAKAGGCTA